MLDIFSPNVAYASVDTFVAKVNQLIVNPLISLLFALAVLIFLFGVFQFIANADNEEKRTQGKSHMIWGIIGITIMMGVFGIMHFILNSLGVQGVDPEHGTVDLPNLPN